MTVFHYVCVDKSGNQLKGALEGDSLSQVHQKLLTMNLTTIKLVPAHEHRISFRNLLSPPVSHARLSLLTFQLGALLSAGLPISSALQNIADQIEYSWLKSVVLTLRTRLLEGCSLSSSMAEFPDVFPEIYRVTVAAGEKTGHLDEIINKLASHLEHQEQIRQKINQAMIYPALLTCVSIAIIIYLMTHTMPTITKTFTENGQSLPAATLFLIHACNILQSYGVYFILIMMAGLFWLKTLMKSGTVRYRFQLLLSRIPFLKRGISTINAARFARTFGILFAAGAPLTEAMQTAANVVTFIPMQNAVKQAIADISKGVSIHQALANTGYFSKMSTQLIACGESSGKLEMILEKTATYQEQQVVRWITTALSLFEPLIILTMGLIVLFIVMAALLPIFQMNDFMAP